MVNTQTGPQCQGELMCSLNTSVRTTEESGGPRLQHHGPMGHLDRTLVVKSMKSQRPFLSQISGHASKMPSIPVTHGLESPPYI